MNENLKFWITLTVGFVGACAWAPFLYEKLQSNQFDGKIISIYNNFNVDKSKILVLFKLSVVSRNRDFFLRDINVKVDFPSRKEFICTSRNMRLVVFTIDTSHRQLNIASNEYLNNLSVLKKDTPEVGYVYIEIPYNQDEPFANLEFVFSSFDKKSKTISFSEDEIKSEKLLFDDSIWSIMNINDPNIQALRK